jgi:AmmeMemoRadiSam system radical SAM enzyme/AmmeMemoRadiSam system protein B/AmmeMemoRadiSam system protein A
VILSRRENWYPYKTQFEQGRRFVAMPRVVTLPPEEPPDADGTKAAGWWEQPEDERWVRCGLCPRACSLKPGDRGFCFVRENRDGQMISTTYGRSTGFCVDPIEKKPLNQFYPGTAVLSFGTAGCNLSCQFCQNWTMSRSRDVDAACETADPETIARAAQKLGCRSVAFTYNDPIVFAEYAMDTARACHDLGVKTVAVTSGYITATAREAFFQHIDAANVDLKGFTEEFYRTLTGGHLEPVRETLRWLVHQSDVWLEITNLIIPRANDSPEELEQMCHWIADELGPDVPVHFSAFHPDFKLADRPATPLRTLLLACETGQRAGLRYVYTGNVSDREHQNTYCPGCGRVVIERDGYLVGAFEVRQGRCRHCGTAIAGRFDDAPGDWGGRRMPVRIASFARPRPPTPGVRQEPEAEAGPAEQPQVIRTEPGPPDLSPAQEELVFRAAGRRVAATVRSQRPEPTETLLAEAADTPVYGAFVSLKRGGRLRSCCGYLGQSIRLSEALDNAAVRAAKDDPRFPPISPAELEQLDMEVWLLWGLKPISARGEDRIHALTIGKHGLQIARGPARGLLLPGVAVEHNLDAKDFLKQVCLKAGLPPDAWKEDDTTLMTFEGYAIRGRLPAEGGSSENPSGENPSGGSDVRPASVAGGFYPATAQAVDRALDELFPPEPQPEPWPGAMVPHAGWRYSGRLAAKVLSRVAIPDRVIILCPSHRPGGAEWAVAPHATWLLPGRQVASDTALARRLAEGISGLELDGLPHRHEHAIEVQLPLLARLAPDVRVVGITIRGGELSSLLRFAEQMAEVLRGMPQHPLLLISSDMSHVEGYADNEAEAHRLDHLAMDAMQTLDPTQLYETVRTHRISMCGVMPAVIVMETLRQEGRLSRCELVGYTTSAQSSGETSRVVGYAGMLLG